MASISAWLTVCVQVYVQVSLRSSLLSASVSPVGPLMAEVQFGSLTVTPVRVTLPSLVTVNV